ncbi:putative amidophosphoribosyltransferase [Desulfosporosinus acidiphilus SJ4]|uniref:Putative amidophosphoribosyltransferase n=1 Tax=Desulfosporosinus acidiphilus (strain DSM 22704 / JCM 16185 / SJ4) TaxID=646529 RepID=I4DCC3_DESAJ|nr:phosphoribosyltransferase family protein [Desulfosporosinus acidiphilus]AFM43447.1 putative amidophosphoribosyltransferase [Desulfosporosinus acidiphilus SJ4]
MKRFFEQGLKLIQAIWYSEETGCVLCGGNGAPICESCTRDHLHPELGRCLRCGKLIAREKTLCLDCQEGRGPKHLKRVIAWGHYSGYLKELILDAKFGANPMRIAKIGPPFADWAIHWLPPADGILAVPMHPARLAERGFNQAEVIVSQLHWELGLPIFQGVTRIKPTPPQVSLSRQERLINVKDAFVLQEPERFQGRSVWLVDDVTTTGTTLDAVAEVLLEGGVSTVYGLCLAAGIEKILVPEFV